MKEAFDVLGPAYARNRQFWKALVFSSSIQGMLLACVALAFFNAYSGLAQITWYQGDYKEAVDFTGTSDPAVLDSLKLGGGEWWYVGMLAGAGFCVGLFKVLWSLVFPKNIFPERIPGFLKHLKELKAHDPFLSIGILIASTLSIGLGASIGPEAALGACGTATGTLWGQRWKIGSYQAEKLKETDDDNDDESDSPPVSDDAPPPSWLSTMLPDFSSETEAAMCNMDGMSASFAAIFPAQFLGALMLHELGGHWGPGGKYSVTETVARTGIAATFAYGLFVGVEDRTLLQQLVLPAAAYDAIPVVQVRDLFYGAILGVLSGIVGYFGFITLGVMGAIGMVVNNKLNALGVRIGLPDHVLGKFLTPIIGGTLLGLINVAAPLNIGDGSEQLRAVVGLGPALGTTTIAVSGLLKLFSTGISLGFGFVGGPIFPLVFTGACMGSVVRLLIPDLPILIAVPTCLVAVPAAFLPAIFFTTLLSSMFLVLGGALSSVVFISCICSYTCISGMGLVQNLLLKAMARMDAAETLEKEGLGTANVLLLDETPVNNDEDLSLPLKGDDVNPKPAKSIMQGTYEEQKADDAGKDESEEAS